MTTFTSAASDLPNVGRRLATELTRAGEFCLWLEGPLGAGKTTLTGHILRALGLPETTPVTSPTYTYMNEYRIGDVWYAHLDLYRATTGLRVEDLGLLDARPYRGVFVEWPERLAEDPALRPTHVLKVSFTEDDTLRELTWGSASR